MLFEILSTTSMAGIALATLYHQHKPASSDHERIIEIANRVGLKTTGKNGESLRIYRRTHNKEEGYTDYVYKMPLGLSHKQFEDKLQNFIDGLNNKSKFEIRIPTWEELKAIDMRLISKDLQAFFRQFAELFQSRVKLNKHVVISYDGMLKFRVYDRGLPKEVKYNDALLAKVKKWQVPIGMDFDGLVIHDFDKMPIMSIAGMSRYGKTVALKNIITTLLANNPNDVEFTLIDLKGGLAFSRFARCKQIKTVAKNAEETLFALEEIHEAILRRQQEFLEKGYEDIGEANMKTRHFVVIDEGAEIAGFIDEKQRERGLHLVGEIARIGAGLGFRLVFATQYPTADVFPRTVKANTSATLTFRLKTQNQSMVVLDKPGAETLPLGLKGRAIYQSDSERLVQTPFIKNSFIDEKIRPFYRPHEPEKAWRKLTQLASQKKEDVFIEDGEFRMESVFGGDKRVE